MFNCKCCGADKPASEFSFQKRDPRKRYAWCDSCRFNPLSNQIAQRRNQNYYSEVETLRSKAVQLRKLNQTQVVEARTARKNGEPVIQIAERLGVSTSVIYNATGKGYR